MLGFIVAGFLIAQFSRELPNAESIRGVQLKVPLRVYSADNLLISEFGNERRKPTAFADTPQSLIDAVLASEDDGFYEHSGVDVKGLFRAAISNFRSGSSGQGASTITMQVARNFFLTRDKTYTRKIKEVLLAFRLEQILSKEEILSLYLNKIFLGHRAYGFGAAADVYYGKELHEISLAQLAMLAGLPKAPSTFNPLRNPERAIIRRNYVLGRMLELGKISEAEHSLAVSEAVTAKTHSRKMELLAPHIAEMVRANLVEKYGEEAYWEGLSVYTTIQSKLQTHAQASLRTGLRDYDRRHGFRGSIGTIDLDTLAEEAENPESYEQALELALRAYPSSQEQVPAVAIFVDEATARLQSNEFGEVEVSFETAKWAKRHKTANLVGDEPKAMTELVKLGDVVYISPIETKPTSETSSPLDTEANSDSELELETQWQLSQIPDVSGALISIEPSTGRILSLVGGYDFFLNKYNRATQSIRQPGSNIKPFIYSGAIDQGYTPASVISGSSIVIRDAAHGTLWRPENYSGKFFGPTRMRQALGKSMNLVSIRILRAIGIPYARDYLERFGIDMNRFSSSLTMALGSGGAKPIEMLSAYGVLANGGYRVEPYFIEQIKDRNGDVIYRAPTAQLCDECFATYLPEPELSVEQKSLLEEQSTTNVDEPLIEDTGDETEDSIDAAEVEDLSLERFYTAPRVMSHANNFLTVSMLKDVVRRGTGRKALVLNRQDLAGKTGTTNDYVDAWFTGFNSRIATTVWVGFDKPQSMGRGEAGGVAALPIWVDYMKIALEGLPQDSEELPAYIEQGFVNRNSGRRTDEFDPDAMVEYFEIPELTPEYALYQKLYGEQLALIENQSIVENDELNESDLNADDQDLPPTTMPLDQSERIIEESEDTEGLF